MTDREKLIDIIVRTPCVAVSSRTAGEHIADHLLANGVVVREKGEWVPYFDGDSIMPERYFQCSNCGSRGWIKRRNFCPNCGAEMRGGINNGKV